MKERKKIRDGIALYSPAVKKQPHPFLLAAVQLSAVWFLAFSWWQSLTGVFPVEADTPRLYLHCFLFTALLTALWNSPLRELWKYSVLLLLFCLAGAWIWRHLEAAVNVINLTANAYLAVRSPNADPYPIQPVSNPEMALMFALFLLPLLFLWSLILHLRKGRVFAYLLLLAPAAFILAESLVPSELSCWLLLLSGGIYGTICGCREGRGALFKGILSACILALLILLSAFTSRPLEAYKEPSDGFYARTREAIETEWIKPLQDSYAQAKAKREEKKQLAQKSRSEQEKDPDQDSTDETPSENVPDQPEQEPNTPDQPEQEPDAPETAPETDIQPDFFTDSALETPDSSQPSDGNHSGNPPDSYIVTTPDGTFSASTDTFPDLNALTHFQPDSGVRLTVALDTRPEKTVYYPSAYGVYYRDSHWYHLDSESSTPVESYLEYPEDLKRLKKHCQKQILTTLEKTSEFIQKEFEEYTVYDFEPGPTPSGQDFAEYFLFDNQKGFCVHFATTAALMYRICGFPSRYVQGYAIPASAFHRQEDGSYAAEVTGDMGHAWCEVLENEEWITMEHTLPYHGIRPEPGIPAVSSGRQSWIRNAAGWRLFVLKSCAIGLFCLAAAALLLFTQAALRRQRRYQKFRSTRRGAGIRRIYRALYDTAVFQGMEKTDILSSQGFLKLQGCLPQIAVEDMEWLYQAVLETMFYQRTVTKEDTKHAWKIYQQFSHTFKKELTLSKKFIYNYIKAL